MTVFEVLFLNRSLLAAFAANGITAKDVEYTGVYEDFSRMKAEGEKVNYITAVLSDRYDIGERTIWRIVKKFEQPFTVVKEGNNENTES